MFAEVKNDYIWGPAGNGDTDPDDGNLLAGISVDAWEPGKDQGEVVANVLLTRSGDILVDFHNNGVRMDTQVLKAIEDAKSRLQKIWNNTHKDNPKITESKIRTAEGVLIDNGIESDEAQNVLQAIGYVLLDTELYPEEA